MGGRPRCYYFIIQLTKSTINLIKIKQLTETGDTDEAKLIIDSTASGKPRINITIPERSVDRATLKRFV